jgi:CBS domain-containing protein
MIQALVVVLTEIEKAPALVRRWREIGVPGTTILRSVGAYTASSWLERVGLSMLGRAFETHELEQRTLIAVIDDDALLERAVAEAETIVGGFDRPRSGVLFVLPVTRALGHQKRPAPPAESAAKPPPSLDTGQWKSVRALPITQAVQATARRPALVHRDDSLRAVASAMTAHPDMLIACVVGDEGRLLGIIRLKAVADDLFLHLLPEAFLGEMFELDNALHYADQLSHRTAADIMEEPAYVMPADTVDEAFRRMHARKLLALPLVDEAYRVIGYLSLLELLSLFNRGAAGEEPAAQTPQAAP